MKHLSDYIKDDQTKLFKSTGAFFAFSREQFEEQRIEETSYFHYSGLGMFCPKETADELLAGLDSINRRGIARDIAENGIKAIIHRTLANYETQFDGPASDCSEAIAALSDYPGITPEKVRAEYCEYWNHCVDNDYF